MASFVLMTGPDGVTHHVNPDRVSDVFPDPTDPAARAVLVMEYPPGWTAEAPPYLTVNGTAAAVAAALAAPTGGGLNGTYVPAMVDTFGFYSPAPLGSWRFTRIENRVMVWGRADMAPANVPPFGQLAGIDFDLPIASALALGADDVPGVAVPDLTLPAPGWGVNLGAGPTVGLGNGTTARFTYVIDSNVAPLVVGVTFCYDLA